jgi:betaine-aldehyde dehydrogenase
VLNIIPGFGNEAGKALAQHPLVDKIAFTGSVSTGSDVMSMAADDIKRVSLELGGKSPFLIFDDADYEKAVEWIMVGIFFNQGRVCSATSRVLVQKNVYKPVLDRLIEEAEKIRIGNGLDPDTKLGPLVSEGQSARSCPILPTLVPPEPRQRVAAVVPPVSAGATSSNRRFLPT